MPGTFFREWKVNGARFLRCICLLLFYCLLISKPSALAQDNSTLPPDVRLVIDVSGSMKGNDPNNLRQPAVELLVQLLPENSKAGVWTFGKWVNMLVPHREMSLAWREGAQKKSADISSVGLFTNIGEALEKAAYDIDSPKPNFRRSIILLTDGMVDIDKDPQANKKEWRRIVDEVLPKLKAAGYTIHTIALSKNADTNLLNKLSLATDGIAEIAHSAEDLMKIFLKAFDVAAPAEQVPLQDNSFVIDSSIEEFTALIFRKRPEETTELIGPDESVSKASGNASDIKWHSTENYDLITVSRPLEGEWKVKADMDPDSRITVVSNLNLRVKPLPNNVFKGQNIEARFALVEDGKIIKRTEFLSLMDVDVSMDAGKGEADFRKIWSENLSSDAPPLDGNYQTALPQFDKMGIYELNILLDGKSFVRKYKHRFTVRQPFGAEVEQEFNAGSMDYILTVKSYDDDVEILKTEATASLELPNGNKKIVPLALTDMDTWIGTFLPREEGDHKVRVRVKGQTQAGEKFDITLDELSIHYSLEDGLVEEEEPFYTEAENENETETENKEEQDTEGKKEIEKDSEAEAGEEKESESPEESTEETPGEEASEKLDGPIPEWMLYSILGVGNLILLVLGYLVYRKLTSRESDEDILQEFSDEVLEQAPETTEEHSQAEEGTEEEPELEEEPPMEDLEPAMEEIDNGEDLQAPPLEEIAMEADETEDPPELEEMAMEADEAVDSVLDDLDQMAVDSEDMTEDEDSQEEEPEAEEEDDDDMVSAMLKAQGLDLAEDELDETISSLIDDMEDDN